MQYSNSTELQKRIEFYIKHLDGKIDWYDWVWIHMRLPVNASILEVGAGHGVLWKGRDTNNFSKIILSDKSVGMIHEAENILNGHANFSFCIMEAEKLAIPNKMFDVLIANHMLYHVNNKKTALKEFNRVIKDDGLVCMSTIGKDHLYEIHAIIEDVCNHCRAPSRSFSIVEAKAELNSIFSDVTLSQYKANLRIKDPEDAYIYINSLGSFKNAGSDAHERLRIVLHEHFKNHEYLITTSSVGLFQCRKRVINNEE